MGFEEALTVKAAVAAATAEVVAAFEQAGAFSDGFFYGEENCANMDLDA